MRNTLLTTILAVAFGSAQSQVMAQTPFEPAQADTENNVISNTELIPSVDAYNISDSLLSNSDVLTGAGCCDQQGCGNCCRQPFESDHAFDGFIEPVMNPVFFEDPRSRTRLRFLFINQMIPEDSILAGGDFQLFAAQITVALNERFAIIAQKDGFLTVQADGIPNQDGWADLATGLKYVLIRDVENQFLLSTGCMIEWSNGSEDVFQGNGDGMWNLFLSAGKKFGPCGNWHFIGTTGWHIPMDDDQESESWFYSIHLDRKLSDKLYVLWELTGIEYVENGNRLPGVNVEGGDLINLGAGDVEGNHFVSTAFGITCILNSHLQAAVAYEIPISDREDLMDNRTTVTLSLIY